MSIPRLFLGATLLLVLLFCSASAQSSPNCDLAYFWFPDGSRVQGSANWAGRYFARGPCTGVSGIGTTQTYKKSVLIIDRTDFVNTYMKLPGSDDWAYAQEIDLAGPQVRQRALNVKTNTFCSTGAHAADGTFWSIAGDQTPGGYVEGDGGFSMRSFKPCTNATCDFAIDGKLDQHRWYPTAQLLPNGRILIVGGSTKPLGINNFLRNVPSVEYHPKAPGEGSYNLFMLMQTVPYNLYPLVHLLPNGLVFIFAGQNWVLFDTNANQQVNGNYPPLDTQDGDGDQVQRLYPNSGTSALFPLSPYTGYKAEIMICGGAPTRATKDENAPADPSCYRIFPLDAQPVWTADSMSHARVMPIAVLLPDGNLLIHGGAATGHQGIPNGCHNATLQPELYLTSEHLWYTDDLGVSRIPRVYHASGILLHDATVFFSGSNPHQDNILHINGEDYPTEFRTEFYYPPYFRLPGTFPTIAKSPRIVGFGQTFVVNFRANPKGKRVSVSLAHPGFSTHNGNHGMRNVVLKMNSLRRAGALFSAVVLAPPTTNIAPPTWYWLFVLVDGKPNREGTYIFLK